MIGRFEEALLLVLISAGKEVTSPQIQKVLADKIGLSELGAINTALGRMAEKKFVTRRKGDPLPRRGGRARNYYTITSLGHAAVDEVRSIRKALDSLDPPPPKRRKPRHRIPVAER